MEELRGFFRSFSYAAKGLRFALRGRNFRFMTLTGGYVLLAGLAARLPAGELALQLLCAGLVLAAEGFNTALEQLCDRVTGEREEAIGRVKDCAAGSVMLLALASAGVWALTMVPQGRWLALLRPAFLAPFLLTLPLGLGWVFCKRKP